MDYHVGLEEIFPYIHINSMVSYALKKACARQISKIYNIVCAACGFLNLFKVDMFLNPTYIEPVRATADKSLPYIPEG